MINNNKESCTYNLSHFGSIYIHGKDAQSFLQGQLTCDVNALMPLIAQPTACCNLQGRIVGLVFLMLWQDGYLLVLRHDMVDSMLKHFKKYALFSKITFEKNSVSSFTGFANAAPETAYQCLNNLFIQPNIETSIQTPNAFSHEAWHYQQLLQKFPDIYPETAEQFLPHRIELEKIDKAISFEKGCYLGQEIIARTHFKATKKHEVFLYETSQAVLPGQEIFSENYEPIGEIIDIAVLENSIIHCLAVVKMGSEPKSLTLLPR